MLKPDIHRLDATMQNWEPIGVDRNPFSDRVTTRLLGPVNESFPVMEISHCANQRTQNVPTERFRQIEFRTCAGIMAEQSAEVASITKVPDEHLNIVFRDEVRYLRLVEMPILYDTNDRNEVFVVEDLTDSVGLIVRRQKCVESPSFSMCLRDIDSTIGLHSEGAARTGEIFLSPRVPFSRNNPDILLDLLDELKCWFLNLCLETTEHPDIRIRRVSGSHGDGKDGDVHSRQEKDVVDEVFKISLRVNIPLAMTSAAVPGTGTDNKEPNSAAYWTKPMIASFLCSSECDAICAIQTKRCLILSVTDVNSGE